MRAADCQKMEIDLLDLASPPEVTLTVGGPERWRGVSARISLRNGYNFFFVVPSDFAGGSNPDVKLTFTDSFKFDSFNP